MFKLGAVSRSLRPPLLPRMQFVLAQVGQSGKLKPQTAGISSKCQVMTHDTASTTAAALWSNGGAASSGGIETHDRGGTTAAALWSNGGAASSGGIETHDRGGTTAAALWSNGGAASSGGIETHDRGGTTADALWSNGGAASSRRYRDPRPGWRHRRRALVQLRCSVKVPDLYLFDRPQRPIHATSFRETGRFSSHASVASVATKSITRRCQKRLGPNL